MNLFESCTPLIESKRVQGKKPLPLSLGDREFNIVKKGKNYFAYPQRCPHRGTHLKHAQLNGEYLVCPYHGWQISTTGEVTELTGPSKRCKLEVLKLDEAFGMLWFNPNQLEIPVSYPSHMKYLGTRSFDLSAPFHVVLDNFNEGSHTPFVHKKLGSLPSQIDQAKFSWSQDQESVLIKYFAPQRPNFLFNGPFWKSYLNWDIEWKAYFNPVRMEYFSKWRSMKTSQVIIPENFNIYFITPNGKGRTWLHALVFSEIKPALLWAKPIISYFSLRFTINQVMEDEHFYQKIADLPLSFRQMHLDQFDAPLVSIRKRVDPSYYTGQSESDLYQYLKTKHQNYDEDLTKRQ